MKTLLLILTSTLMIGCGENDNCSLTTIDEKVCFEENCGTDFEVCDEVNNYISLGLQLENAATTARYCSLSYVFEGATVRLVEETLMQPQTNVEFSNIIMSEAAFFVSVRGGCRELSGEFSPWGERIINSTISSTQMCKVRYVEDPAVITYCH